MSRINYVWLATYEFRYLNRSVVRSTVALTRSQNAERLIQPLSNNPEILTGDDSLLVRQVSLLSLDKVPLGRGSIASVVEHLEGLASERDEHDSDDAGGSDDAIEDATEAQSEADDVPSESGDEEPPRRPLYVGTDLSRRGRGEPIYMDLSALNDSSAGAFDPLRYAGLPSEDEVAPKTFMVQSVDDLPDAPADTHLEAHRAARDTHPSTAGTRNREANCALDDVLAAINNLRPYLNSRDDQQDA